MNVNIKSFDVKMDVKNKGIEFEVRSPDGKTQLGDCYLTKTGLIWCPGKTKKKNGIGIKWEEFISLMSDKDTLKLALSAVETSKCN
jgi:hypothetical protein